jgi:dihydropteroate synthase
VTGPTVHAEHSPRILFVTGRLAEFALRQLLNELAPRAGFIPEIAVLPISVAALMTPRWAARHLDIPSGIDRILLPGHCQGDLAPIQEKAGNLPVELGPEDLRDLPRFFGQNRAEDGYGSFEIEILAEINHAPRLTSAELLSQAKLLHAQGADVIDLGTDPGTTWKNVGDAVKSLRDHGLRVSIDSHNPAEIKLAVAAGAELVLSVNGANRHWAPDWGVEVVAIPDRPDTLQGLDETVDFLNQNQIPFRIDPILEPIGFGFAASLGRYLETRARYPQAAMLMGVGNLTELTDVDSAGINVLLLGFCQELRILSVLTTSVINWARSAVRELDLGRRLVHHAISRKTLPKHLEPNLICLRDPKVDRFGPEFLAELQRKIRDPNWRIFAEDGQIHALNHRFFVSGRDPFKIFREMEVTDPSHAFYLGYEMMKAKTALTLGKTYRQDQALQWGHLTEPEPPQHSRSQVSLSDLSADSPTSSQRPPSTPDRLTVSERDSGRSPDSPKPAEETCP